MFFYKSFCYSLLPKMATKKKLILIIFVHFFLKIYFVFRTILLIEILTKSTIIFNQLNMFYLSYAYNLTKLTYILRLLILICYLMPLIKKDFIHTFVAKRPYISWSTPTITVPNCWIAIYVIKTVSTALVAAAFTILSDFTTCHQSHHIVHV